MGTELIPTAVNTKYRLTVEVPAFSTHSAELTVGLFYIGQERAVAFEKTSIEGSKTETVKLVHTFDIGNIPQLGVDVRVGVSAGKSIYLNGNDKGPDKIIPNPKFIIEELKP